MKKSLVLLTLLMMFACKEEKKEVIDLTPREVVNVDEEVKEEVELTLYPKEERLILDVIIPMYYDKEVHAAEIEKMNDKWLSFYDRDGLYKVVPAKFEISEKVNECNETDMLGVFSPGELEPLFFMGPNTAIEQGIKDAMQVNPTPLWPGLNQEYLFNGKKYTLCAEGIETKSYNYTDEGKNREYKEFMKYKLYLSVGTDEQQVLNIPEFNDKFITLLFVGDLDGDGNLDFVFDTSSNYEEKTVEVYLSKGAKHLIYLAGVVSVDFSC
ncbi:MAG: hypothetical protein LBI73_14370 [Myroides sp.]|jgi:hypothetical protein|nr:hypothetical protein [Myroides sp.]